MPTTATTNIVPPPVGPDEGTTDTTSKPATYSNIPLSTAVSLTDTKASATTPLVLTEGISHTASASVASKALHSLAPILQRAPVISAMAQVPLKVTRVPPCTGPLRGCMATAPNALLLTSSITPFDPETPKSAPLNANVRFPVGSAGIVHSTQLDEIHSTADSRTPPPYTQRA